MTHASHPRSSRLTRRRFVQGAIAAASGLTLSGCGWRLGDVSKRTVVAGDPTELFVYTWAQYVDQPLLDAFRKATGIRAMPELFDSNEAMIAAFQAGKGTTFSVIYPSEYAVTEMVKKGFLAELDHEKLVGLENLMPQFRKSPIDPGNRYSIPFSWGTTGLIYNSEKLSDPPTDWEDLWRDKEKLTRRMTLLNDFREVFGAALKSLGHSYNETDPAVIKQACDKLLQLKPYIASFTTDAWRDQIVAGDLWLAMGYSTDAQPLLRQNPQLKYVIPKSGSSRWSDQMVIPKTAPNPEGAYRWINYLLQPEVAAEVSQRLAITTPNQTAIQLLPEALRHDPVAYPPQDLLDRCEIMQPLERSVAEVYDKYWAKLTS